MNVAIGIRPPNIEIKATQAINFRINGGINAHINALPKKVPIEANVMTSVNVNIPVMRDSSADIYDGEYVVIPKAHEGTVLPTQNKLLLGNVTVVEVPYYETSNYSGTTVYIANEVI